MSASSPHASLPDRAAAPGVPEIPSAGALAWRPQTPDDAAALLELENAVYAADGAPYRWSIEEIVEGLAEPWRDLPHNSLIGLDEDQVPRAWAQVYTPPGDQTVIRVIVEGGVHPDRRGEGIGRELLAWSVARGRELLAGADQALPAVIRSHVEDSAPLATHHLFERAGFTAQRFFADLRRDLAEPLPEVGLDGSLRLLAWSDTMDEPARLAHNDAFRDHWGSQPQSPEQWAGDRSMFVPGWSFVVVDEQPDVEALVSFPDTDPATAAALRAGDPLVVGYALASRYAADFEVRGYPFGYTDVLGVRRGYRGRRVAVALLAAQMRAFAADGMRYAVLDVDTANPTGAFGLYSGLGYVKEHSSRAYVMDI
jgi:ribosomal protein S18 acetylase RimI-like enzyme